MVIVGSLGGGVLELFQINEKEFGVPASLSDFGTIDGESVLCKNTTRRARTRFSAASTACTQKDE